MEGSERVQENHEGKPPHQKEILNPTSQQAMPETARSIAVSPWLVMGVAGLVAAVVVISAGATSAFCSSQEGCGAGPVVVTEKGAVRGVKEISELGKTFYSFYGIPYADPPVGTLRFQAPIEASAWKETLDGSQQPSSCLQIAFTTAKNKNILTEEDVTGSEDCLYLNVFTPQLEQIDGGLAVMVYLHGGGYMGGSARLHPPGVMLNQKVILVVPQFRVGTLGFLSTEDSAAPGNAGLKDQTQALRWVQTNIHHFGGNPYLVTLFGESSGASSTHLHVLSPKSDGLFSRAILHSGTAITSFSMGQKHKEVALETARDLGCTDLSQSSSVIKCLQAVPATTLTLIPPKYYQWFVLPFLMGPRVDGDFLPADPYELLKEDKQTSVDLMAGLTAHDGGLLTHVLYKKENMRTQLVEHFEKTAPITLLLATTDAAPRSSSYSASTIAVATQIFNHYLKGDKVEEANADNVTQLYTDYIFGVPVDLTAQLHTRNNNQSNMFIFELTHRGQRSMGELINGPVGKDWVTHADDLLYLFSGGPINSLLPLTSAQDLRLRDIMTRLWVNFANTGNPTPDDSLGFKWEPVKDEHNLHHLALQPLPEMRPDTRAQVRELLKSLLPQHQHLME